MCSHFWDKIKLLPYLFGILFVQLGPKYEKNAYFWHRCSNSQLRLRNMADTFSNYRHTYGPLKSCTESRKITQAQVYFFYTSLHPYQKQKLVTFLVKSGTFWYGKTLFFDKCEALGWMSSVLNINWMTLSLRPLSSDFFKFPPLRVAKMTNFCYVLHQGAKSFIY